MRQHALIFSSRTPGIVTQTACQSKRSSFRQNPPRRLARLRLALLPAAAAALLPAVGLHAEDACPDHGTVSARLISFDERLELTLGDGSKLKIAGIDPPRPTPSDPDLDSRTRGELSRWLAGQEISFYPLEVGKDRWGRIVAFVYALAPQQLQSEVRLSVGEALIDAGLARYEPSAAAHACRSALLAAERGARALRLGLWADPYYAVIGASDRESLAERAGSPVVVEGRVTGTAGRRPRLALYFGPRKGVDLSVTMFARNSKEFEAAYSVLAGLAGATIRVRGFLDTRFGPQIEISNPDAVEIIGQQQDMARTRELDR